MNKQTSIGCICVTRQYLVQIIKNLAPSKTMRGLGIALLVSTADLFQTFRWTWQEVSQRQLGV